MRLCLFAAAATLLSAGLTAHADSITTFALSGNYTNRHTTKPSTYAVSGTITIDTTTGIVDSVNLKEPQSHRPFEDTYVNYGEPGVHLITIEEDWGVEEPETEVLYIPAKTLIGYHGGSLCSLSSECVDDTSSFAGSIEPADFNFGQLTPAATPEPSSFLLLSTGLLGIAGAARRRLPAA